MSSEFSHETAVTITSFLFSAILHRLTYSISNRKVYCTVRTHWKTTNVQLTVPGSHKTNILQRSEVSPFIRVHTHLHA